MTNIPNKLEKLVENKLWKENLIRTVTNNPTNFLNAFKKASKTIDDFINCKWTKIEGSCDEPFENIPVHVSFDENVQDEFFCIRFCEESDSREWYFLDETSGKWELFSDYCDTGDTPTYFMLPIKPEPPKIIPESPRY